MEKRLGEPILIIKTVVGRPEPAHRLPPAQRRADTSGATTNWTSANGVAIDLEKIKAEKVQEPRACSTAT